MTILATIKAAYIAVLAIYSVFVVYNVFDIDKEV